MTAITIPRLRSELLSSTALTPTQHKGGLASLVSMAVAIAIPFAAPYIATAIGLSGAIASATAGIMSTAAAGAIGGGLVGGAMGAAFAAATGGNIAMGAIGSATAGAISGYNYIPSGGAATAGAGINTTGVPQPGTAFTPIGGGAAVPTAAAPGAITGADINGFISEGGTGSFTNPAGSFTTINPGVAGVNLTSAPQTGTAYTPMGGGATTPAAAGLRGATQPPSFLTKAGNFLGELPGKAGDFLGELPGKFLSSEGAQQAAGKLVTQGIGNLLAGDDPNMTDYEKAKMADLEAARGVQKGLLDEKKKVSQEWMSAAANTNPDYYGQQKLSEDRESLLRAQQAGLRGINPSKTGLYAATVRRNALDNSRLSGFVTGRKEGTDLRNERLRMAQSSAPDGAAYAGNIASDLKAADAGYQRLGTDAKNYQDIFKPIADEMFSLDSAKERARKREMMT